MGFKHALKHMLGHSQHRSQSVKGDKTSQNMGKRPIPLAELEGSTPNGACANTRAAEGKTHLAKDNISLVMSSERSKQGPDIGMLVTTAPQTGRLSHEVALGCEAPHWLRPISCLMLQPHPLCAAGAVVLLDRSELTSNRWLPPNFFGGPPLGFMPALCKGSKECLTWTAAPMETMPPAGDGCQHAAPKQPSGSAHVFRHISLLGLRKGGKLGESRSWQSLSKASSTVKPCNRAYLPLGNATTNPPETTSIGAAFAKQRASESASHKLVASPGRW